MKIKNKVFGVPHLILAVVALLALIADTVMLFSFSYAPLWAVFIPAILGLGISAVLIAIGRKGAVPLSAIALLAGYWLLDKYSVQYGVLPAWAVLVPAALAIVLDVILYDLAKTKESIRKFFVSLKRNPSMIPLVMLLVSFLLFSLNLTYMSDTTAKIQGKGMGLCQFCIMLFSLLSMVCMLNAFPRRKKPNIPMVVLMFVMFGLIIYCNIHYSNAVLAALYRAESPIKLDETTQYIAKAYNMLGTHMVLVIVTAALVALLPVYSKLLRKINTSVAVDDNGQMAEIEIND